MIIRLYGYSDDDHDLLRTTKTAGQVTKTIKIPTDGDYWINPIIAPGDSPWSVSVVALKKFSSTPTPKISGTAKVRQDAEGEGRYLEAVRREVQLPVVPGEQQDLRRDEVQQQLTSKYKVKVTGSKSGYLSVAKTSKATSSVKK